MNSRTWLCRSRTFCQRRRFLDWSNRISHCRSRRRRKWRRRLCIDEKAFFWNREYWRIWEVICAFSSKTYSKFHNTARRTLSNFELAKKKDYKLTNLPGDTAPQSAQSFARECIHRSILRLNLQMHISQIYLKYINYFNDFWRKYTPFVSSFILETLEMTPFTPCFSWMLVAVKLVSRKDTFLNIFPMNFH